MFFTLEKLERNTKQLKDLRYRERMEIPSFDASTPEEEPVGKRPESVVYTGTLKKGDFWIGRGTYLWIRQSVEIPAEWVGKKIAGLFNMGKTGEGLNSGFEGLIYVNGSPYCETGSYHEEVIFPSELAGTKVELAIRLWAGLEGGGVPTQQTHQFKQAELAVLDEVADDFYYSSRAVVETVRMLDENDSIRRDLLTAMDRAHLAIDWRRPGSDAFYGSLKKALEVWKKEVSRISWTSPVTVHTVGHSHIDVAWLWQLKHTREKAARTFSTMCTLMEQYPEFTFVQSQPQLYDYIKTDYPDIYKRIQKAVKTGNWEPNGAMWVEADCNISSGEALVRQILNGQRFFKEEFGVTSNVLWLPDVFGYSWALPQILKRSGIESFMTIKISWNQYNHMPHDTFRWIGVDGSEVLTHFMSVPAFSDDGGYTYNGVINPASVKGTWDLYHDKEINQDLLLAYGNGDGGGGVNRDMLEMGRHLKAMPGLPEVIPGTAYDYFENLQKTIASTDRHVPTWDGELYLEYHRGTYTSQARNKKNNRKTELKLREAEWLASEAAIRTGDFSSYPEKELHEAWKIALRNQFHDIIPGSSIHEVYEDSTAEYAKANEILDTIEKNALKVLVRESDSIVTVVNNSSFAGEGIVTVKVKTYEGRKGSWFSADGKELPAVYTEDGWFVKVSGIEPAGFTTLTYKIGTKAECFCTEEWTGEMDTPFYHIVWDKKGRMTSIFDKENDREILKAGELGNHLVVYEDRPMKYDAWDIDIYYQEKGYEVDDLKTVSVEKSSLMTKVKMDWNYQDSTISQEIRFYNDNRRIDFVTHADWHEHQQLLRVLFPLDIRTSEATFDIQYGNVKRPTYENTSWDMAKFETVAHQWADYSETGYGVSLMNDCKYGYSAKGYVLGMSLIKCGIHPDYAADQGIHDFTYALYPHSGSWQESGVQKEAWRLNNPLWTVEGAVDAEVQSAFCKADTDHVAIDCIKKAEDSEDLIIRFHEYAGMRGPVTLNFGFPVDSWQETDLMENPDGEEMTGELKVTVRPYEIRTFRVTPKK